MLLKRMRFPTVWENNPSVENQNIDVWVEAENGYVYILVVATAKNLEYLMNQENLSYFSPGHPFLIVQNLTLEIIKEAIKAYAEENDGYWLKFYHFAGSIGTIVFDELQAKDMKKLRNEKLDE